MFDIDQYGLRKQVKNKVVRLTECGLLDQAIAILEDYRQTCPDDNDYYSIAACLQMMAGDLAKAEEYVGKGLGILGRDNYDLLYNLFQIKMLAGDNLEAASLQTELRLRHTGSPVQAEDRIAAGPADRPPAVLHGTMEIANQMRTLSEGLQRQGVNSKTVSYYPTYLKYKADFEYDLGAPGADVKKTAAPLIRQHDIFHFHYSTTLAPDYADLPLLKEMGKTVVMHHWGSDVRLLSVAKEVNPYIKVKATDENEIKRTLELLARYIDHAIVADYELYLNIKDFYNNIHFLPQALNLAEYPFVEPAKKKDGRLLLVHAPTSPEIKGSQYIFEAVEKIKPDYNIEFKLIQGMSHEEAKGWYRKADLIVDEILCGAYGLLAIECMSMGKPVISWIPDYLKAHYPKELPLISANPDTIEQVLRDTLDNRDALADIGRRGRAYVEKYHDSDAVSRQLIGLYGKIRQ